MKRAGKTDDWCPPSVERTAYLSSFLFSGLPRVAPYCVPAGATVVSIPPSCPPSTKSSSCWFYDLLRRALKSPSATPQMITLLNFSLKV